MSNLYAVKNKGDNILTVPGRTSIHPGEVETVNGSIKDQIVDNFEGDVEVKEYTPKEDEAQEDEGGGEEDHQTVQDLTISELEDELETGEYDDRLNQLLEDEKAGEDRKGAKEAIKSRQESIEEGE